MIKDKLILGITVGLLADVAKLTFNYIGFKLGFAPVIFWQLIAALLLEKDDIYKPVALVIGGITDVIVTAFLGVVFIYFIYYTGKVQLWIKGIGFAMLVWVGIYGVLLVQLIGDKVTQEPPAILVTIIAHFIFGVFLVILTRLLGENMSFFYDDRKEVKDKKTYRLLSHSTIVKALEKKTQRLIKPKKI